MAGSTQIESPDPRHMLKASVECGDPFYRVIPHDCGMNGVARRDRRDLLKQCACEVGICQSGGEHHRADTYEQLVHLAGLISTPDRGIAV